MTAPNTATTAATAVAPTAESPTARAVRPDRVSRRTELAVLAAILVLALAVHLYNLGDFPDTILADEADNAQDALRITYGLTPENGVFGLDWTGQPALSAYILAAFIYLFGFTSFVIRFPTALISVLALVPFFFLLRRQFSLVASSLATLLLASLVWYLNFSRSAWNNIHVCFYMLGAMACLMLALDAISSPAPNSRVKWLYFAAVGAFCALGLNAYPSGRAIVLGIALFFPVALWFYRRRWKELLAGYAVLGLATLVLILPLATYVLGRWEAYTGRSNVVALTGSPEFKADPAGTFLQQLSRNVRGLWDGSVNNTAQYTPVGEPQLDTVTAVLVLAGMLLSLLLPSVRRRPETWLWWSMLLVAWFATQVLTVGTPNGARGIGYMPTLVYFAAVSLDAALGLFKRTPLWARRSAAAGAAVLLVDVAAWNVSQYAEWQSKPRTRQDRYLYITAAEFPAWTARVKELAAGKQNIINVGGWRDLYPIEDIQNPQSPAVAPTPQPAP
ncbi:MAG TPA: glycosyltransferase family 39 protein [Chloroflexia bacterium]|nr:glycosyltransferase family 39 protein [Chloroflexia bacterium]